MCVSYANRASQSTMRIWNLIEVCLYQWYTWESEKSYGGCWRVRVTSDIHLMYWWGQEGEQGLTGKDEKLCAPGC